MRALHARPAESEQKLSYVALADLVVEAFDEVGAGLPQVQQHALAGAFVREDADGIARFDDSGFRSLLAAHIARSVQDGSSHAVSPSVVLRAPANTIRRCLGRPC